jgi:hypothetical protein
MNLLKRVSKTEVVWRLPEDALGESKMPVNFDGHLRVVEGIFGDRKILSPFDKRESISLKEAAAVAGKSESTLRGWCEVHGLGRRIDGGTWSVSNVALAMFLDGDLRALRAYHAGDRTSELVVSYFRRAGLGCAAITKSGGYRTSFDF